MTPLDVPVPARVVDRVDETHDVVTLWVEPVDGPLPEFAPAQFSMIGLPGLGEVPISISSPVSNRIAHSYTIRRAGAVTRGLCDAPIGEIVMVRGPMGRAWNLDAAAGRHVVFVAGGLGIAPLRAAIHAAVEANERYASVTILLGATSPPDVVYRDWLESLSAGGVNVDLTVDRADNGAANEAWPHGVGLVTTLFDRAIHSPGSTSAFICGPDVMMAASIDELAACGVPRDDIQVTLERNMYCGYGTCGHCQLGRVLVCRDGPVFTADELGDDLKIRAL